MSYLDSTFAIFNISAHGDPVPVGHYNASSGDYSLKWARAVFVQGDYAYTVSDWDDTLVVWDISAHGDPVPVAVPIISSFTVSAIKEPALAVTVKEVAPPISTGLCDTDKLCGIFAYTVVNASPW